jgi:hypothetical protein
MGHGGLKMTGVWTLAAFVPSPPCAGDKRAGLHGGIIVILRNFFTFFSPRPLDTFFRFWYTCSRRPERREAVPHTEEGVGRNKARPWGGGFPLYIFFGRITVSCGGQPPAVNKIE